jgi:thiol-disulfide isomerase/thioredoxin
MRGPGAGALSGATRMKAIIYAAVAVVAAAAGFAIYRFALQPNVVQPGVGAPVQASTPTVAATEPTPEISGTPDILPDFTLTDVDGQPRSIRSWSDKSMIVNFWATWCAPCRREIPYLKKLQQDNAANGFQVVGVAVDVREDVLKYAKEISIDYPLIMGEQDGLEAVGKFGLGSIGFPFTVFTDNQHRIIVTHLGELHPAQADVILGVVAKVNRGELTPASARAMAVTQLEKLDTPEA